MKKTMRNMLATLLLLFGGMAEGVWAATYTYHIVNNSGVIAISYKVNHDANSEALEIPEVLRSPLITFESGAYSYYKEQACSTLISTYDDVDTGNEIFVRYDYANHRNGTYNIDLSGATAYRMLTKNGFYLMQRSSNTTYTGAQKTLNGSYFDYYLWTFKGNDPYNIEVYNEAKDKALSCETVNDWYKDMDFASSVNRFILFRGQTDGGADEGYWYLVSPKVNNQSPEVYAQRYAYYAGASNDNGDKMRICANDKKYFSGASNGGTRYQSDRDYCKLSFTMVSTYTYHLIGRDGTEVLRYKAYTDDTSTPIALNENLVSPYAKNYHYYDTETEAVANNTDSDFTTYSEVTGTDIYVGYDYDDTAGLDLTGGTPYSFRAGESEGNYYLGFPSLSTNARPNYAYTGDDNQLFLLKGSDPYRIQMECKAYSGYHVASSWQGGNPVNGSGGGHTGTQVKLYNTTTETSFFSMLKNDKMFNFPYHTANSSRYVMYIGGTQWFNIYGGNSPYVFNKESQISSFCSSALPITLTSRIPKVSVTLNIVSIDKGAGSTILYSPTISADKGGDVAMPTEYSSPLAKNYKFYTLDQFTVTDGKYTLKVGAIEATTFPTEDGQALYVKYEYDADNSVTFGSNTINVDLSGMATYTINNNTEATKGYLCWGTSRVTLDTSDDSYQLSFNNTADPAEWNDFYLWTFHGEDPYAITIRNAMPDVRSHFLTPQNGLGGSGSHSWLVPDSTKRDIIRTWALLSGNRLISQPVPGNTTKVVTYRNSGWTYQDNLSAINN